MKVLVLSHMYPSSFNEVGGIFVHEQVRALIQKGVEVRVVSPVPISPFPINRLNEKWQKYSEIPHHDIHNGVDAFYPRYLAFPRAWFFSSSGKRMHRGMAPQIKSIYKNFPFDLLHAHVALPDGYAGALLANELGVPLVVTIHGQDLQHTVDRDIYCRDALAFVLNYASKVILVSNKLKHLGEELFGHHDKLAVIPNGIDPEKITGTKCENISNTERPVTILSVSNLITTKGIDLNLKAISRLQNKFPRLRYMVVGEGVLRDKLKRMATSLGLADCVQFLGRMPHDRVMQFMADCDIFSLPSWNEAFGVVYVEAMAHGKPVIGCRGEGIQDFVEHGKNGLLVKPRDVDSLVEAFDYLLSHPEGALSLGERGRQVVLQEYTWEKNAEKTIEVYNQVLKHVKK